MKIIRWRCFRDVRNSRSLWSWPSGQRWAEGWASQVTIICWIQFWKWSRDISVPGSVFCCVSPAFWNFFSNKIFAITSPSSLTPISQWVREWMIVSGVRILHLEACLCNIYFSSLSKLLRHRGPDWNGITCFRNCYLAHERLAINGLLSGAQVRDS